MQISKKQTNRFAICMINSQLLIHQYNQDLLTEKVMQFFISTFLIMLICIIALLQDKSQNSAIVLSRPQKKRAQVKKNSLTKCSYVPRNVENVSSRVIIDKNESQTEVFAALLIDKLINSSNTGQIATVPAKPPLTVQKDTEKNTDCSNVFCSQCNLNLFAPAYSYYKQHSNKLQISK